MLPQSVDDTEKEALRSWCQREVEKVLESLNPTSAQDCEAIVALIQLVGLRVFMEQ